MTDYQKTLEYLYERLPMFHRIGPAAFKKDLTNTLALCEALGNPQNKFPSIHIAGTNGKGSVSHLLASILQESGYKTGLYTSPHLVDFRERIRVNGAMIPEGAVVDFVESQKGQVEKINPSFFELTVAMAFDWFAKQKVDIAVIETGLGGRLDSTNVITPLLSVITNISYDHQNLLGNTLAEIAFEKAGIIKPGIPAVIGRKQTETAPVFERAAKERNSRIFYTENTGPGNFERLSNLLHSELPGNYQAENLKTVLTAVNVLSGMRLPLTSPVAIQSIENGIRNVKRNTGLRGRWEVLSPKPYMVCDVAHNEDGLRSVFRQALHTPHDTLRIVYGMVKDKNVEKALNLLPNDAQYYFCSPALPRALDVNILFETAASLGLTGKSFPSVAGAFESAREDCRENDLLLVTGSFFVVGEVLEFISAAKQA